MKYSDKLSSLCHGLDSSAVWSPSSHHIWRAISFNLRVWFSTFTFFCPSSSHHAARTQIELIIFCLILSAHCSKVDSGSTFCLSHLFHQKNPRPWSVVWCRGCGRLSHYLSFQLYLTAVYRTGRVSMLKFNPTHSDLIGGAFWGGTAIFGASVKCSWSEMFKVCVDEKIPFKSKLSTEA